MPPGATGQGRWPRFAAMHLAGYLAFTALHTGVMLGLRGALYPLLGWSLAEERAHTEHFGGPDPDAP